MSQPARRIVETLVLAATTVLLLGHGGGSVPTCFAHAVESRTFNIVGTCGPAGVVTVTTGPCSITLTGDDVGLPASGNLGGTLDDGFQLYGSVNSDWDLECDAAPASPPDAGAQPAGAFGLSCRRRPSAANPDTSASEVDWCVAELWPVTPTCDIHACAPVTCSSAEHTAFSASGCCPACVANGPNDILPVPPPPVCHRDTCSQSCPAGQELFTPADACCGTCQTPSQACLDGRAQWVTELEARWSSARVCAEDADCTITAVSSRCGETTCNDAIAVDQLSTLVTWAAARGEELCPDCTTEAAACSTEQPARPVCSNGTCVLTGL